MKFVQTIDGMNEYHFICEGCKSIGTLKVPMDVQAVHCPEECGAMYIQWNNPLTESPDLQCVVCPVFNDNEEGTPHSAQDDEPGVCSLGYDMKN